MRKYIVKDKAIKRHSPKKLFDFDSDTNFDSSCISDYESI